MRIGGESVPLVLGQATSDLKFLGPTSDGQVAFFVLHEGRRLTVRAEPEEAEQLGLLLVKASVVAHLKRRAAGAENGAAKPAVAMVSIVPRQTAARAD